MAAGIVPAAGLATVMPGEGTLPPEPDVKAAYDSIVRANHFGVADDVRLMESFIARYPASSYVPEVKLMMADRYFFQGLYPLAVAKYSELSADMFGGETRKEYAYRYAYSLIKSGYYDEAQPLLNTLLGDAKYADAANFYTAYILYVNGDYDKAYGVFKEVRRTSERGLEAEYYINQIDFRNGRYRDVADRSRRLLAGDVDYQLRPETMRVAGISLYRLGDDAHAKPLLEEYVETKGDGAETTGVYTLAAILYSEGDYSRAADLFSSLTDDRNELAQSAWLYLGQISAIQGDDKAAAMAFDRASKDSWNHDVAETAAFNLSVASASGSRLPFADTAREMENFIISYPGSPYSEMLQRYLVNAYYNQHDYEKALQHLGSMDARNRETALLRQKVNYQRGVELIRDGKNASAIPYLKEAAGSGMPDKEVAAQASLWLGDAYYAEKKYTDAATAYAAAAAARETGANTALANYNLGYARMKLKEYSKAGKAFEAALKAGGLSASQKADAQLRHADCLYYTGAYAEAMKEYKEVAKAGGSDAVYAGIREADILGRQGKIKEKIALLQRLVDNGDAGVWTPVVYQRLGDAYSENGEDSKAAAIYARMLESDASDKDKAQSYYALAANAEKLYMAGKNAEALEAYRLLEKSAIPEIHDQGVAGIMRTATSAKEIVEYADKTMKLPGVSADLTEEAQFRKAQAQLTMGTGVRGEALASLEEMAKEPDTEWGSKAALALGQYYLDYGKPAEAERVLLKLTDSGCDDNYTLARGYILLADAYIALDKKYLARLYLETLRDNYPGRDKAVYDMIDSRLKKL